MIETPTGKGKTYDLEDRTYEFAEGLVLSFTAYR